jgi:Ca-activated chloride channel family protein
MTTPNLEAVAPQAPGLVSVDGRTYPLESVRVEGRAEGGIALTRLVQRFRNPHEEALEVLYTMPLPADGAVLGYVVRVGEKVVRGEVEPREKAEADYRRALYEGRTAGLLEQERADTFTQRLGNVPGKTDVEVTLEVLQPLAFLAGVDGAAPQWEYRFPTVVGVRYEGAPGRVGDAAKLDVGRDGSGGIPTRVELELTLADATATVAGVAAPGHEVVCEPCAAGTLVRFAAGQRLDRDVVLRWDACTGEVGARLVEGGGLAGDDGRYGLLTVVPPAAPKTAFHRDVTVLIDASGSMGGMPLSLAKRVVGELLRGLEPGDRFELLAFANGVEKLTDGLVALGEESLDASLRALGRLQADGGTEMLHAVEEALRSLREDAQRQVVLVTDGYIGFEAEVVGRIGRRTQRGVRLHAVGIGAVPNRTLVAGAARAGRGVELLVSDEATADAAARRLAAATARPVLTDLAVTGTAVVEHVRGTVRDVFAGKPLVVPLELSAAGGTVVVTGRLAGAAGEWRTKLDVPAAGAEGSASTPLPIGALFGREAVADLEGELTVDPRRNDLLERIERCALRHRIVSRRTSLVAIAEEPSVDPRQPKRRERLAVELPAGVSAEGVGLAGHCVGAFEMEMAPSSVMSWSAYESAESAEECLDDGIAMLRSEPQGDQFEAIGVVREPDGTLVVEFEVPWSGFVLPERLLVLAPGRAVFDVARVVQELSSPLGPQTRGLVVRIALRLALEPAWPPTREVLLVGTGRDDFGLGHGGSPFTLRVQLPSAGKETPRP